MIEPQADADYLVELCSGEQRRWRCLPARPGDRARWWRDVDDGREFAESSVLYAWRIVARMDLSEQGRAPMTDPIDRLCVEQMADALIYADRQGVIRQWNAAAEALFGFPRAQAIGQSLDLIIPENLRAAHQAGFDLAMQRGVGRLNGQATVTKALNAAGGTIYVEMSFAVITDAAGQALGSVAIARDASQRRRQERELRELRERLAKMP